MWPILSRPWTINLTTRRWLLYRAVSDGPRVVKKLARELPKRAVGSDGLPLSPLAPFDPSPVRGSKRSRARLSTGMDREMVPPSVSIVLDAEQQTEWARLVDVGVYPDTPLAKEVYANRLTYPDDLLLTRVGMFYESYFEQAVTVASLLGIRLTSKKFNRKSTGTSTDLASGPVSTQKPTLSSFPFAGFPCHAASTYFRRLLEQNRSFVVVEEMDDKTAARNDSKTRFVSRKYTPGTMMSESWQMADENRYLMAIALDRAAVGAEGDLRDTKVGLAYIDISTDRAMMTKNSTLGELEHELVRVGPVEVVIRRENVQGHREAANGVTTQVMETLRLSGIYTSYTDCQLTSAGPVLGGLSKLEADAVGLAQRHLSDCLLQDMPTLLPPNHQSESQVMQIDASTLLGLEIRQSLRQSAGGAARVGMHSSPVSRAGTLLSVIKRTLTPSGTRKLVNNLCQPSAHLPTVRQRLELVDALFRRSHLREDLRDHLRAMSAKARGSASGNGGEIGRTLQKYLGKQGKAPLLSGSGVADGRDLWELKETVEDIATMKKLISDELHEESRTNGISGQATGAELRSLVDSMRDLTGLTDRIAKAVVETALHKPASREESLAEAALEEGMALAKTPLSIKDEKLAEQDAQWWISPSFSPKLQHLHDTVAALLAEQAEMQVSLRGRYASGTLELKFGISGFYVHMTKRKGSSDKMENVPEMVPLTSSKSTRTFQYAPWTTLGVKIGDANKAIAEAQRDAFNVLRAEVCSRQEDLLVNADILSEIDVALGFAQVAEELRFVRPDMHDRFEMSVIGGRHPTVEYGLRSSPISRNFVPNSLHMDGSSFLHLISGPNQGGKSTALRQTAIIAILAQAGSFVPAEAASLGIVDAVFSRVGARDDLYQDKSTFMMEMSETAHILRRATKRSLVIMDEIGRGTTLLSGIAIAYATLDYILKDIGCRTLFATHYHELAEMLTDKGEGGRETRIRPGVEFWCTDVDEGDGHFSYAYKLRRGVNRRSHAIKVARQAGVPASFLKTAEEVLGRLEADKDAKAIKGQ